MLRGCPQPQSLVQKTNISTIQQGVTAEGTRTAMAAVRAMALVMMAATTGAMVTAMAAVHLVSTVASAE